MLRPFVFFLALAFIASPLAVPAAFANSSGGDEKPSNDSMNVAPKNNSIGNLTIAGDRANDPLLPDLVASGGGFDSQTNTNWVLVVTNTGMAKSAPTNVVYYLRTASGTEVTGKFPLPAIDAGKEKTLVTNSLIPVSAIEILFAHIDRPAVVDESDETNNKFTFADNRSNSRRPVYHKYKLERATVSSQTAAISMQVRDSAETDGPRSGKFIDFAEVSTGNLIKCGEDQQGVWGCNCSKTNHAICAESMKFAGCKTIKQGGLANPDVWEYSCGADHSDE
ncbi:MAG: CARDB domain-containing protein [Pseudomonadota bacterium]